MSPDRASAGGTPVTGLSHVAIAVAEADPIAAVLVAALGATRGAEELIDDGGLRIVFLHLGPVTFELLEPRRADHTVARFLADRGPGLHHVSLDVADLEGTLARCREAGVRLIDATARPGAHGTRVAFLHPKSLGGVLVELCDGKGTTREAPPR
jgi:methylmalonyl-CoA/ethylmalonyl-CoA epimerase